MKQNCNCYFCGAINHYSQYKTDQNRKTIKRKKCVTCGKRFKVTPLKSYFIKLDKIDTEILKLIRDGKSTFCSEISRILKISKSTISRKLKKLEISGKIEIDVISNAKFYKLKNQSLDRLKPMKFRLHNVSFACELIDFFDEYKFDNSIKMNNWFRPKFTKTIGSWYIEFNLHNVIFRYKEPIYTYNPDRTEENLRKKAYIIKHHLESKGFVLGKTLYFAGKDPTLSKSHVAFSFPETSQNFTVTDGQYSAGTDESEGESESDANMKTIMAFVKSANIVGEIENKLTKRIDEMENKLTDAILKMGEFFSKAIIDSFQHTGEIIRKSNQELIETLTNLGKNDNNTFKEPTDNIYL